MAVVYAEKSKLYAKEYLELYIPQKYFVDRIARNQGDSIEVFGILYGRTFPKGTPGELQMVNFPTTITIMQYGSRDDIIKINGRALDVLALEYPKDSYIMHQSIVQGRDVANEFLSNMLEGNLPDTLNYKKTINCWWKNLEISGVSLKVPSKEYEMVIASIYRNPKNPKERYGQYYGRQADPSGFDYKANNVRSVVKDLSTFSGMVFEDIGTMISNGISNSVDQVEEDVSPLEKIIHY